ncbi:caspase family protein [Labrys neptuniae]
MLRLKTIAALIGLTLAITTPATAQIIDYSRFEKAKPIGDQLSGTQLRLLQSDLAWDTGYNSLVNFPLWGNYDEGTFVAIRNFQSHNLKSFPKLKLYQEDGIPSPELIKLARSKAAKRQALLDFKTASAQGMTINYPASLLPDREETATGLRLRAPRWDMSVELQAFAAGDMPFEARFEAMKASPEITRIVQAKLFKARAGRNPTYFALFGTKNSLGFYARFIKAADGSARGVVIRWNADTGNDSNQMVEMFEAYDAFAVIVGSLKLDEDDGDAAAEAPISEAADLKANRQLCGGAKTADDIIKACSDVLAVGDLLLPDTLAVTNSNRGWGFYLRGDYDKAIADYNEAIALRQDDDLPFSGRGYARFAKGDNAQAIADFDQALRLKPVRTELLSYRASAALKLGRLQESVDNITSVVAGGKAVTPDYLNRGVALLELGRKDEATADLSRAIDLASNDLAADPAKNAYSLMYRAMAKAYGNDPDGAIADATRFLSSTPQSPEAFHARGLANAVKQNYDAAIADYTKAIDLGRKSFILRQRGDAYLASGQPDLAATDYLAMLHQFPTNPLAASGLEKAKQAVIQKFGTNNPPASDPNASGQGTPSTQKLAQAPAAMGKRIALIIGNGAYTGTSPLPNPKRDAARLAETFRSIGFTDVTLLEDLDNQGFNRALQEFSDKASQADWAVVYYAGHGMEVDNVNYLIPVDAKLKSDRDILFEAVPLDRVMAAGEGAKSLRLVILDACRNNPFEGAMAKKTATRSVTRGLSRVEPDGASLVVYAAKAGQVALDGDSGNSPFVTALDTNLRKPNVEIGKLFRLVRDDVMKATDRQQEPFTYGSLPGEDFFFNQGK